MPVPPRFKATGFLFATVAAALAATPAAAQKEAPPLPGDGTEVLQFLLDAAKIKPIKHSELSNVGRHMEDVIVIALGQPRPIFDTMPAQWANNAISSGGAALIATDAAYEITLGGPRFGPNPNPPKTKSIVTGQQVTNPNPNACFLGKETLPFVEARERPQVLDPEWELFAGLSRVATNRPSAIQFTGLEGGYRSVLAGFPVGSRVERNGRFHDLDPRSEVFALGGSGPHPATGQHYRLLALSDPSVFINEMMLPIPGAEPTDNYEFAWRVVAFLSQEGPRRRKQCLFIQNGQVIERFDKLRPLVQPPVPRINLWDNQHKIVEFADKVVDRFEEQDVANKVLLGKDEEQRSDRFKAIMAVVLAMLAIRAAWYLMKRMASVRRPPDGPPAAPGGLPLPSKRDRPPGVFERRQSELLRRNNLSEPVRTAIQEMFAEAGVVPEPGQKMPKVTVSAVVARPDTLREALVELWKIAARPRAVSVQRWRVLEPLFVRARQAHRDGKWSFGD